MDGNITESWGTNSPAIVVGKFQWQVVGAPCIPSLSLVLQWKLDVIILPFFVIKSCPEYLGPWFFARNWH
jgi:hypothetical protein